MIHPLLKARLEPLAKRQHRLRLGSRLTVCWFLAALAGLAVIGLQRMAGWSTPLGLPLVAVGGLLAAIVTGARTRRGEPDWRSLAGRVETAHPELDGRLITAVQQHAGADGEFSYLQQRLLDETLACNRRSDWTGVFPAARLRAVYAAHLCALGFFGAVLWGLRVPSAHGRLLVSREADAITVTPGDVALERGSSLVVMAWFKSSLPGKVNLVLESSAGGVRRVPLARSLADPLFGGTVPEVLTNTAYHLEYTGRRTRDYQVTVFSNILGWSVLTRTSVSRIHRPAPAAPGQHPAPERGRRLGTQLEPPPEQSGRSGQAPKPEHEPGFPPPASRCHASIGDPHQLSGNQQQRV